jgi:hypothetical protein
VIHETFRGKEIQNNKTCPRCYCELPVPSVYLFICEATPIYSSEKDDRRGYHLNIYLNSIVDNNKENIVLK